MSVNEMVEIDGIRIRKINQIPRKHLIVGYYNEFVFSLLIYSCRGQLLTQQYAGLETHQDGLWRPCYLAIFTEAALAITPLMTASAPDICRIGVSS